MSDVTLTTPLTRIRAELDDPNQQRYDDAYIMGFVDQCNEDMIIEFASKGIEYGEQVIEITGLPINTTSLSTYQAANGALQYMILPILIEWKNSGEPATSYQASSRVDKVADIQAIDGIVNWEFRSGTVYLTPSTAVLDIRVRFFGMPSSELSTQQSTIFRSMLNVFVYKVAQKIASRNGNEQLATDIGKDLWEALENIEELLIKQDQSVRRKFGRQNQPGYGTNWRIPTTST